MIDHARLLLVDDRPENLLALEAILEPLEAELVRAGSGEEALRRLLHERVRGDPARRPDAGHGRLPDRRADQAAGADETRSDPLPDRDLEGRRARLPRLQHRRRRLSDEAIRPADPAGQGRGLHRALAEDGRDQAPRRASSPSRSSPRPSGRARCGTARSPMPCPRSSGRPMPTARRSSTTSAGTTTPGSRPARCGARGRSCTPRTSRRWTSSGRCRRRRATRSRSCTGCCARTGRTAGISDARCASATRPGT